MRVFTFSHRKTSISSSMNMNSLLVSSNEYIYSSYNNNKSYIKWYYDQLKSVFLCTMVWSLRIDEAVLSRSGQDVERRRNHERQADRLGQSGRDGWGRISRSIPNSRLSDFEDLPKRTALWVRRSETRSERFVITSHIRIVGQNIPDLYFDFSIDIVEYLVKEASNSWKPPVSHVKVLTNDNFADWVESHELSLVEFYSPGYILSTLMSNFSFIFIISQNQKVI